MRLAPFAFPPVLFSQFNGPAVMFTVSPLMAGVAHSRYSQVPKDANTVNTESPLSDAGPAVASGAMAVSPDDHVRLTPLPDTTASIQTTSVGGGGGASITNCFPDRYAPLGSLISVWFGPLTSVNGSVSGAGYVNTQPPAETV